MNLLNITLLINTIRCASDFVTVREVFVLENNFREDNDNEIESNGRFLKTVFVEFIECTDVPIKKIFLPSNCYHDQENKKYYNFLCHTDVNLNSLTENPSKEKQKLMKFEYTYSTLDCENQSAAWGEKTFCYHNYKIFKSAANGSIEFESNKIDIHLYHIKQILHDIFTNKYLSLKKINSIKKKKINTEFPDFTLLHFESLLECHKSLKRFVRFLNCFKLVGKYPDLNKKDSSSEDGIDLKENNASEINEGNNFDNNTENNLPGSSLADIIASIGDFRSGESIFFRNLASLRRDSSSDSSSSEESDACDNNVLIIDKQPWRKKALLNIAEESSIDLESSSNEEDYTIDSPNKRLKLLFLKKFLKEKFDKDFKAKKVGDENGSLLCRQIKILFRECCDKITYSLLFDSIILPLKGDFTMKFYLDKFYEIIKRSIDFLIEDFDNLSCKKDFVSSYKHLNFYSDQVSAFYTSIKKNTWEQFNAFEHFSKVIGKDISNIEDFVAVEKVLCDYYNMMSTTLREKYDKYDDEKPILVNPLFNDNFECRILKMIEVTFKIYIKVSKIYGYDSSSKKILLKKNEDFVLEFNESRCVLLNIEKIRCKDLNEIEVFPANGKEPLRFTIHEHLNNYSFDE